MPLNKRLSKHSWGWWFETPSCRLWRHCNGPSWILWLTMKLNATHYTLHPGLVTKHPITTRYCRTTMWGNPQEVSCSDDFCCQMNTIFMLFLTDIIINSKYNTTTTTHPYPLYTLFCIVHFKLQIAYFVHSTKRESCIKIQNLFVVSARPLPINQNVEYECFRRAFQIFHIFSGIAYLLKTIPWCWYNCEMNSIYHVLSMLCSLNYIWW